MFHARTVAVNQSQDHSYVACNGRPLEHTLAMARKGKMTKFETDADTESLPIDLILNKTKNCLHFLLFFAVTPHLRTESYGAVAALTGKSMQLTKVLGYRTVRCVANVMLEIRLQCLCHKKLYWVWQYKHPEVHRITAGTIISCRTTANELSYVLL